MAESGDSQLPLPDPDAGNREQRARLKTIDHRGRGDRRSENSPTVIAAQPTVVVDSSETEDVSVRTRTWRTLRRSLGGIIASTFFHSALLVCLALVVLQWKQPQPTIDLLADFNSPPKPQVTNDNSQLPTLEITLPENETQSVLEDTSTDQSLATEITTPSLFENSEDTSSKAENEVQNDAPKVATDALPTGGGLQGRNQSARSKLATQRGGSPQSEQAVERGLRWLIQHQLSDGSWRLDFRNGPCRGRCRNPGTQESTTAATGLALMALLGAGYTHQDGPYQTEVKNGIDYLLSRMRKTYFGGNLSEGTMYAQGIATIALSEAFAMTRDPTLKEPVELAQNYIVTAQHSRGGWRYVPGEPGDMTVTGWQIMALKSCEISDINATKETWDKAREFLGSLGESGGCYFGYRGGPGKEPSPTAIGLLMQMYLGWSRERNELAIGTDYLVGLGPSKHDIYFNYYATLVMHHYGGEPWEKWNAEMRDFLVKTQDNRGHAEGSWYFRDEHGQVGGRLYTTAMAIMILEVYYRYLPLYERGVDP